MNHPTLPKGYVQIDEIDLMKNKRQFRIVNLLATAVMVILIVLGLLLYPIQPTLQFLKDRYWAWFALAGMLFAYVVLHELTHGVLMRMLSGARPKYGFQIWYAYAGSDVFFDRRSYTLIALAPLVLWTVILFILERTLPAGWFWLVYVVQLSNISGCAGDVYCVWHLSKLPKDRLVQDSGTRMLVYARDEEMK